MLYLPKTCWWFEDQGRSLYPMGFEEPKLLRLACEALLRRKEQATKKQSGGLVGLKIGDGPNFCGSLTVESKACHVGLPWVSLFSDKAMYALNVFAVLLVDHVCLVKSLFLLFNLN